MSEYALDVDQSKVDACKDFAESIRDRIRGTNFEYEMLSGKRCDGQQASTPQEPIPIGQDDDALIERCNALEHLLRCILEDVRNYANYDDKQGKYLVSSELIGKISDLLEN